MEINVADLAGSLGGGGRYDNLVGMFLGQSIPACGFSLGLERILVVMGEREHVPAVAGDDAGRRDDGGRSTRQDCRHAMRRGGARCAQPGCACSSIPDADKIGKQIKYADSRGIPFVAHPRRRRNHGRHGDGQEPRRRRPRQPTTSRRRAPRFSRN